MMVTTLSGVILMKALGTKACAGPCPCAATRTTGSRYAATSMPPPARAETRRNDRRSSWYASFVVIVILGATDTGFGLRKQGGNIVRSELACVRDFANPRREWDRPFCQP